GLWATWPAGTHSRVGRRARWLCPNPRSQHWRSKAFISWWRVRQPMSERLRRFGILLPLRFNDGQAVPDDLIAETLSEIEQRFGAVSAETQTIRGFWQHQGEQHRDTLTRVYVDVADVPENREFFTDFKQRLKTRFRQLDIWLTTYPVEAL